MMHKIILTHMWIDHNLLLARDITGLLFMICPEDVFFAGPDDSLKKGWNITSNGKRYRKIKKTKQCHNLNSASTLADLTNYLGLSQIIKKSYDETYT
jgi:hypothetical protein